jgi:flagellin
MVQIAEGAMDEATTILQRMRDLAVQAANDSLTTTERTYLDTEQSKLSTTLNAVLDQASFNGKDLIDTNAAVSLTFQVGADNGDTLAVSIDKLSSAVLSVTASGVDLTASTGSTEIAVIDISSGYTFATGTDETYSLVVDGTTYTTASVTGDNTAATNAASIASALQTTLQTDSGDSGVTVAGSATAITITWSVAGQHEGDYALTSASNTTAGSVSYTRAGVDSASDAIVTIDTALATVYSDRASLGAIQAQMESTVRNLSNVAENTAAAAGRIMDTDYAAETANLTKAQILQQAATSILAQANAQPQSVLTLLQ